MISIFFILYFFNFITYIRIVLSLVMELISMEKYIVNNGSWGLVTNLTIFTGSKRLYYQNVYHKYLIYQQVVIIAYLNQLITRYFVTVLGYKVLLKPLRELQSHRLFQIDLVSSCPQLIPK